LPLPLYKEAQGEEENTHHRVAPRRATRSEDYSIAAHRCATGIPDLIQTDILLQSWLD
jgi:hypothetical protein